MVNEIKQTFGFVTNGKEDQAAADANIASFASNISLDIDQNWEEQSDGSKNSWADFRFRQMPLISVLPLLTKFQTDAKNAEALGVGKLSELAGGKQIVFNKFFPVISAKKGYVLEGDKFEAELSVGTYSDQIDPNDVTITVNGKSFKPNKEGKVTYTATANKLGTTTLQLSAAVKNPLTGEVGKGNSEFSYEVGKGSVTVSATKMNVLYIGVDNPIKVSAAGVSSNNIKVSAGGGGGAVLKKGRGNGEYVVTVSKPAPLGQECEIRVSAGGLNEKALFRVKRIPDPVAKLGNKKDGSMGNGEFKAQRGVIPWLEGFDFDAKCQIQGFNLVRVAKRQDPVASQNNGGTYNEKSMRMVRAAKPGDTYYFENVRAKCPGDAAGRKINSMVFKIK